MQQFRNRLLLALACIFIPITLSAFVWKCSSVSVNFKGLGIEYSFVKGAECPSIQTFDIGEVK